MLNEFLSELFNGKISKALYILEKIKVSFPIPNEVITMLRLAILKPEKSFLSCQKIFNVWSKWGYPSLKPNPTRQKIVFLSDLTAEHFPPMIKMFSAAQGVDAKILLSGFDSIEQTILDTSSEMYQFKPDVIALIFSEYWLQKYIGNSSLVKKSDLEIVQNTLSNLISTIKSNSSADILIGNLPGKTFSLPSGIISLEKVRSHG